MWFALLGGTVARAWVLAELSRTAVSCRGINCCSLKTNSNDRITYSITRSVREGIINVIRVIIKVSKFRADLIKVAGTNSLTR